MNRTYQDRKEWYQKWRKTPKRAEYLREYSRNYMRTHPNYRYRSKNSKKKEIIGERKI
jgi:mannosyltransferase OCH1-like enzyme